MAAPDETKPAAKPNPAPTAKSSLDDDDDGGDTKRAAPAPKQKMLPTGLSRAIVIATVFATLAIVASNLYGDRYELVPAPNSTNGFMYKIDKLTGAVQFCAPAQCSDIPVRNGGSGD